MTRKKKNAGSLEPQRRGSGDSAEEGEFRIGYVALVGRPNVGKSTILNQLLGQKIAATTHKPQTTRKNLLGILHPPGAQLLILDTPGYHSAKGPLNRYMIQQAKSAIQDADVIGYVIEAREDGEVTPANQELAETLAKSNKNLVLLINKIDTLKSKVPLLPQIDRYRALLGERLEAVVPISALTKSGFKQAIKEIARLLPKGEPIYEEEALTSEPERDIVAEFIREKAMLETHEELPYACAVTIDAFEDERPRLVRIFATLHVEKDSQKPIVIGRRGERLKTIGTRARKDIEHLLGAKVFLDLNVRVTESWSTHAPLLEMLGYGGD
jgi:GTPase